MAVSGSSDFELDVSDYIEEAFERCGIEVRTGYDLKTAKRSLNLLFADWANRGLNQWTIKQRTQHLTQADGSYNLGADVIDVLSMVVRRSNTDYSMTRVSRDTYTNIPSKTTQSRPTQFFIDRQITPTINIWPLPDNNAGGVGTVTDAGTSTGTATFTGVTQASTSGTGINAVFTVSTDGAGGYSVDSVTTVGSGYAVGDTITVAGTSLGGATTANDLTLTVASLSGDLLVFDCLTRINDADTYTNTMDVPFRFYPCLAAGLAYYIALKRAPDRVQLLKAIYDEEFDRAQSEDRDRASFSVAPNLQYYRVG
tara:strand:- start:180 stop:1112 length:933 start_codon:yes stop_codon:yes gene_type:complete